MAKDIRPQPLLPCLALAKSCLLCCCGTEEPESLCCCCRAEWVCEQEPLQQVARQQRAAQEQGSPAPVPSGRQGGAVAGAVISTSTAAAAAAPTAEASEGVRQVGRRVLVSTASVRSTAGRGSKKQRSGAGIMTAAFSSPELDRLVAGATEEVRCGAPLCCCYK